MRRRLARWILGLFGWEAEGDLPDARKYVAIGAPHTSNWDFPVAILTMWAIGLEGRWVGKHTLFRPPFGWIMRKLGGLALNRETTQDFVSQMVERFAEREELVLVIAPEGTRSRTPHWRTGFYWIAHGARVPIALGYLDYGRKRAGVARALVPSGDLEADFEEIRAFYAEQTGKRPERTSALTIKPREA